MEQPWKRVQKYALKLTVQWNDSNGFLGTNLSSCLWITVRKLTKNALLSLAVITLLTSLVKKKIAQQTKVEYITFLQFGGRSFF